MFVLWILVGLTILLLGGWLYTGQPTRRRNGPSSLSADPARLRRHVEKLSITFHPRNCSHPGNLDLCAAYIAKDFEKAGAKVGVQTFQASGKTYRNVVAHFPGREASAKRFIVGAHYDSCWETPGADDNASGVAGLLEMARLIGEHGSRCPVELVAYTLEEPPYFRSQYMGSYVHASRVPDPQNVRAAVVLEMIGYFSDRLGSQCYPLPFFHLFYPSRGNYIGVVSELKQRRIVKEFKAGMKGTTPLPVYSVNAPRWIPGIELSDHRNYWPFGMEAFMITDTAFLRNHAYHQRCDTADRLDYTRMGQVVVAVYEAIQAVPS